ncbi:hypothetical protein Trydic_g10280 [Trypoxylus dichotomus]
MVPDYIRKTNRQEWSLDAMEQAISAVINREMGLDRASSQFSVSNSTLVRYVKKRPDPAMRINKNAGKFKCLHRCAGTRVCNLPQRYGETAIRFMYERCT